ncbi:hypothetical protein [Fervidobacterium nodosum]|uniref:Uncharacterized protein n=1 Tax=Fervidobacterium nodosum (strain ATCC 35602 / DSM 5306 / Rt17-B1) TaxID=381764 RepID=A7HMW1_FERNB|nr:hypothetical protein [Fervidobacterium nodosum]ABS61244.1 hypothetical protein Fnod_1398 [Fervidobacterium nodosum Rt17-B1]
MKKLGSYKFYSQLVIFYHPAKTVGSFLNLPDVYMSRSGTRSSRPGLLEEKGSQVLVAFLSTKNYSGIRFNLIDCCPLANERIYGNENYIMKFHGVSVFRLPVFYINNLKREKKIVFVAGCSIDLEHWSDECVTIERF